MAVKTVTDTGGNWASASTWSPSGVPSTTADNVVFTSTSGPLTVSSPATIETISFANWQNTLYLNDALTVTGNMNFGTSSWGMSFSNQITSLDNMPYAPNLVEKGRLILQDTASIVTNGKTWSTPWQFSGTTETITLNGDLIFGENVYFNHTGTFTINRVAGPTFGAVIARKSLSIFKDTSIITGSATFSIRTIDGTGYLGSNGGVLRNNIVLEPETSGLLNVGSFYYGTGTLTAATSSISRIKATQSSLSLKTSCSVNTSSLRWGYLTLDTAITLTFLSDFYITNTLDITAAITMTSSQISQNVFAGKFRFENESNAVVGSMGIYSGYEQANPPTGAAITQVLLGNLDVKNLTVGGGAYNLTLNRYIIYVHGNLLIGQPWYYLSAPPVVLGTTEFHMVGTGSIDSYGTDLSFITPGTVYSMVRNNILINTSGTITLGRIIYETGSFSHVSGTIIGGNLVIDDSTARITFPGHTWSSTTFGYWLEPTFGYFTNRPGTLNRTFTYDWLSGTTSFSTNGSVFLASPTFSLYTQNLYASCTVSGTSSIYIGEKGITSSRNVTLFSSRPVCNRMTVNTTGKVRISQSSGSAQFIYADDFNVSNSGSFSFLSGSSDFGPNHEFRFTMGPNVSSGNSINFYNNGGLTFSELTFENNSSPSLTINIFPSTQSVNGITLTASKISFRPSQTGATGPYTEWNYLDTGDIFIGSQGLKMVANSVEFETPGKVAWTDYAAWTLLADWGIETNLVRITATPSPTAYNDVRGLTSTDVGYYGNTVIFTTFETTPGKPKLLINNGTYSIETNCNIDAWVDLGTNSRVHQRPPYLGLNKGAYFLGNTVSFFGDIRMKNLHFDSEFISNHNWGTSSFHFYDEISLANWNNFNNPVKNVYHYGFSLPDFIIGDSPYLNQVSTKGSNSLTFSVSNLYLRPRIWDRYNFSVLTAISTTYRIGGPGTSNLESYINVGIPLPGGSNVNNKFYIGTFSFGTQSNYGISFVKSSNNTQTEIYIDSFVGSTNSNTTGVEPILISSTWSGATPSNRNSKFVVSYNATQDLQYVNTLRVDSSEGATVWSYKGTFSNTTNWNQLPTQPRTISYSSSS
jgi:hypothetical protein